MTLQDIIAIIAALGGLSGLFALWHQRSAKAQDIIIGNLRDEVERLGTRVLALEQQHEAQQKQIETLKRENAKLREQNAALSARLAEYIENNNVGSKTEG